jgi:hypothetical protein
VLVICNRVVEIPDLLYEIRQRHIGKRGVAPAVLDLGDSQQRRDDR